MKNRKKFGFVILMIAIVLGCGIAGYSWYRLRGSVKVFPGTDIAGAEPVFYYQKDPDWAADPLGDSTFTMKSSGCLVSSIAAAINMSDIDEVDDFGTEFNPELKAGELNRYFSENQVYDQQGNLQWTALQELAGYQADVYDFVSAQVIEECLQQGRYPIVRVRMQGYGNFHYVLIVQAKDGMFHCMDPMTQKPELVPLSEFGNRVYAIRCVYIG